MPLRRRGGGAAGLEISDHRRQINDITIMRMASFLM